MTYREWALLIALWAGLVWVLEQHLLRIVRLLEEINRKLYDFKEESEKKGWPK